VYCEWCFASQPGSERLCSEIVQYVNVELQRCLQAGEGGPFVVEVIVHTTATYGDRFRPIIKHRSAFKEASP